MNSELVLSTAWGPIRVVAHRGRIIQCHLPHLRRTPKRDFRLGRTRTTCVSDADGRVLRKADTFLRGVLMGRPEGRVPVELPAGGPFIVRAWRELEAVPAGRTITYRQLAKRSGRPRAARAAGQACATNPVPLFIPCHRVLASDGGWGGFSAGLPWKRHLLAAEGAVP